MNLILITGCQWRHRFFVNHLNAGFHLQAVFLERFLYDQPQIRTKEEKKIWDWFFYRRSKFEYGMVATSDYLCPKNKPPIFRIPKRKINTPGWIDTINALKPDLIVIFATSLLSRSFLDSFPHRILNLHVGLSNHYRGSSCNFWPIYEERLDCLGATIHFVDCGIDTGNVVLQQKITLEANDDEQTLCAKPIILGTQLMIQAIQNWQNGSQKVIPQSTKGNLYKIEKLTPTAVGKVKRYVETGALRKKIRTILEKESPGNIALDQ